MAAFASNNQYPKHLLLNSVLVQEMPDLIETLPDTDDYFLRLEQAAKECEMREIGGCDNCSPSRSRLCWALWDRICDLSAQGKLRWVQHGDAWHYDDERVRDTVSKFLKVTKANSQTLREPQEFFIQLKEAIYRDRQGRYRLR